MDRPHQACLAWWGAVRTAAGPRRGRRGQPGGGTTIAFQTTATPGPAPKELAVTGGTGIYRNVGGDGTLVEFGNGKGKLTLHLLSLVPRGGGG